MPRVPRTPRSPRPPEPGPPQTSGVEPALALAAAITTALRTHADPERAAAQQRYMKDIQPFWGVPMPLVRRIAKEAARPLRLRDRATQEAALRALWTGERRESRYAALHLARGWKALHIPASLPLFRWMAETGAWWDLVDGIAAWLIGPTLRAHPVARAQVWSWIRDEDLWLRRAALLSQLGWKAETDWPALQDLIGQVCQEQPFFMRKAVGWVLRDYAHTNPAAVRAYVAQMGARLSPLSRREALKHL